MSDWLQQLSELEQQASRPDWRKEIGDRPEWQEDKGYLVTKQAPSESVVCRLDWPSDMSSDSRSADAALIVALRNSAPHLIERARRAEELERENESRYSDREAFLADANLMIQEKTRIMHEVQELTTQMPPAALKFMGYALIEAGRNP